MTYIMKLFGWDKEVMLQFLQPLKDGVVEMKGLMVPLLLEIVAKNYGITLGRGRVL